MISQYKVGLWKFVVILISWSIKIIKPSITDYGTVYKSYGGSTTIKNPNSSLIVKTSKECALTCFIIDHCKSFSYNVTNGFCQLYSINMKTALATNETVTSIAKHYEKFECIRSWEEWSTCVDDQVVINETQTRELILDRAKSNEFYANYCPNIFQVETKNCSYGRICRWIAHRRISFTPLVELTNIPNLELCCDKCRENQSCDVFQWTAFGSKGKICYIGTYDSVLNPQPFYEKDNFYGFSMLSEYTSSDKCTVFDDMKSGGYTPLRHLKGIENVGQCCYQCKKHKGCIHFFYYKIIETCYLADYSIIIARSIYFAAGYEAGFTVEPDISMSCQTMPDMGSDFEYYRMLYPASPQQCCYQCQFDDRCKVYKEKDSHCYLGNSTAIEGGINAEAELTSVLDYP